MTISGAATDFFSKRRAEQRSAFRLDLKPVRAPFDRLAVMSLA
jgi:hypothetical protein